MGNVVGQSTSVNIIIGPLMTTGGALVSDLTIANNQIVLVKEASVSAARSNTTSAASIAPGLQRIVLNSTDTNTLGTLTIFVSASAMMPYAKDIEVWNVDTWNLFYGSADNVMGSAAASVLMSTIAQRALTNYDVPTSADISAIVTVVVANALTQYDVPTSADISAIVTVVVANALTQYDVPTSADISAIGALVLTNYDAPTSADISAITSTAAYRAAVDAISNHDIQSSAAADAMIRTTLNIPSSAAVSAIVVNAVWNKLGSEPTTAPIWDSVTRGSAFDWLLARSLNRHSQTTGTIEIYTSAGAVMASASVSNNSVSATRDQFRG